MVDLSEEYDLRQQRRITFIFHFTWIIGFAVFVLLMRMWLDPWGVAEDLEALEQAETEIVDLDRPLPDTLMPLTTPLPTSAVSETVYVPLYRSLYVGEKRALKILAATLSIHNTSLQHPLIINSLTYFDGNGEVVVEQVAEPHVLPPLAAAELYIDYGESDTAPIASAVVHWSGDKDITSPLVEAVIVGKYGAKGFSVLSRGASSRQGATH